MQDIKSIREVINKYDVFLVDIYGVLNAGSECFPAALNALKELMDAGKRVCLLSNTSATRESAEVSCSKRGIVKSLHYDEIITSGGVMKEKIDELNFIHQIFEPNKSLFPNGNTCHLEDAKYVYIGIPKYNGMDIDINDLYNENGEKISIDKLSESDWRLIKNSRNEYVLQDIFNILDRITVPILCANPDIFAQEKVGGSVCAVLRQGAIAMKCAKMWKDVICTGKPYSDVYKVVLENLNNKALMIGDTPWTDIAGANNIKIDSLLVLTGSYQAFECEDKTVDKFTSNFSKSLCLLDSCDLTPTYIIEALK